MTTVEWHSKRRNLEKSLVKINSAILTGLPFIIGYTKKNLRFGRLATDYFHIGGKPVKWWVGYADPKTIEEELREHAASLGKEIKISFCDLGNFRGCLKEIKWIEGKAYKTEAFIY